MIPPVELPIIHQGKTRLLPWLQGPRGQKHQKKKRWERARTGGRKEELVFEQVLIRPIFVSLLGQL